MSGVLFAVFFGLLIFNMPVVFALFISSMIALWYGGIPIVAVLQRAVNAADSFILLAIPFFMVAGNLMSTGGISNRLISFANSIVGFITGGLAHVNVVTSMLFAGITGSAVADTVAVGSVIIPAMNKDGYRNDLTAAVTCCSSVIGVIIPPSIPFVIYGVVTGASIGKLFLAGMIPGILIGIYQMVVCYYASKKHGYGTTKKFDLKVFWESLKESLLALLTPVMILGGIVLGIVTPSEAALLAIVYALIVGFLCYKELSLKQLPALLLDAAKSTAIVMFMICGAYLYGWIITNDKLPERVLGIITGVSTNPTIVLLMFVLIFLIAGMFIDLGAGIILLVPVLFPIVQTLGIDPIVFGTITVISLAIGLVTPPVGACLFIASEISEIPIVETTKASLPFILGMLGIVILIIFFPQIVLYLPQKLM